MSMCVVALHAPGRRTNRCNAIVGGGKMATPLRTAVAVMINARVPVGDFLQTAQVGDDRAVCRRPTGRCGSRRSIYPAPAAPRARRLKPRIGPCHGLTRFRPSDAAPKPRRSGSSLPWARCSGVSWQPERRKARLARHGGEPASHELQGAGRRRIEWLHGEIGVLAGMRNRGRAIRPSPVRCRRFGLDVPRTLHADHPLNGPPMPG